MITSVKRLWGVVTLSAVVALGASWCQASERSELWRYLQVARVSDASNYELAVDTRGLPHIVILDRSNSGMTLTYQVWSGDRWTRMAIHRPGSNVYISELALLLDDHDVPQVFFIEGPLDAKSRTLQFATLDGAGWRVRAVAQHRGISQLRAVPGGEGGPRAIYDYWDGTPRDQQGALAYARVTKTTVEEKVILPALPGHQPLALFVAVDARNELHISFTAKAEDGYEEVTYLQFGGEASPPRAVSKGNYHFYSPITLSRAQRPCIYVYNGDQDGVERMCLWSDRIERVSVPNTKDAQLPVVAQDSTDRVHIAYVDFTRLAYGKQELRYVTQRGDGWASRTIDYGMNANVDLCLDAQDQPHLLYKVSRRLKYATIATAIRTAGPAAAARERAIPDLNVEKLPITPRVAMKLVRSLPRVKKESQWADRLDVESYPTAVRPTYLVHHYTVIQDDATSGHTATAGWYRVNAYTGQVVDEENRMLVRGKQQLKK